MVDKQSVYMFTITNSYKWEKKISKFELFDQYQENITVSEFKTLVGSQNIDDFVPVKIEDIRNIVLNNKSL